MNMHDANEKSWDFCTTKFFLFSIEETQIMPCIVTRSTKWMVSITMHSGKQRWAIEILHFQSGTTHTHDIYIYIHVYIYIQIYFLHAYIDINTCIYYLIYLYTYVYIMYYTTTGFPNLLGTQMQQQFSDADYLEVRGAPCGHKGCETCGPQTWISSFPLKHVGKTIRG